MKNIISSRTKLKCTQGTNECEISENNSVYIEGMPIVKVSNKNIKCFGMCKSKTNPQVVAANGVPQPCNPVIIGTWINSEHNYLIENSRIVLEGSIINCAYAAMGISISNSYTSTVKIETSGTINEPKSIHKEDRTVKGSQNKNYDIYDFEEKSSEKSTVDARSNEKENRKDDGKKFNTCPFCGKKMDSNHNDLYYDDITPKKVNSIPESLRCERIKGEEIGKYKTANHHIIPVNEAYNKFQDLVVLSLKCGVDINSTKNGIPLPTPTGANPYKIITESREILSMNFGDFDKSIRREIAYRYMKETGKQWHSGHHSYNLGNETNHYHMSYSKEVIKVLTRFEKDLLNASLCYHEDKRDIIQRKFYDICSKIRKRLEDFQEEPKMSRPFYVSKFAVDFAREVN